MGLSSHRPDAIESTLAASCEDQKRRLCEEQAQAALFGSGYASLSHVQCRYRDGVLVLTGCVASYYLKQIAQSVVARRLNGTAKIDNCLEVAPESSGAAAAASNSNGQRKGTESYVIHHAPDESPPINQLLSNRPEFDLRDVRVLLVDPDEALRADYYQFLAKAGAAVAEACNGLECVERLRCFEPHVMVLEPEMPWGSGAGVLDWMFASDGLPTTPVIVHTAARDLEQLRRILRFPLYDLAVKPLTPRQLANKVRWVVDFAPRLGKVGWPR
jgi:CheY-like chemotaxis protein